MHLSPGECKQQQQEGDDKVVGILTKKKLRQSWICLFFEISVLVECFILKINLVLCCCFSVCVCDFLPALC